MLGDERSVPVRTPSRLDDSPDGGEIGAGSSPRSEPDVAPSAVGGEMSQTSVDTGSTGSDLLKARAAP